MSGAIDPKTFDELNKKVDLLKYASQTIDLEQRGDDWWGRCPLHIDKTPSFSITPSKNYYYCFSCGCHGGIVNFLRDFEHLSYSQAIKKAMKLAKIDDDSICKSQVYSFMSSTKNGLQKKITPKHRILSPNDFYNRRYIREAAQEWVDEGIHPATQDLFKIRIDKRGNRIIYPVYDADGNFINIKGRTRYPNYKELKIPKYISYFPVGTVDYLQGMNVTLPYIKEKGEVIIFESLKSVMKAWGWGYKNAVSAEKHTLTDEQFKLVLSLKVDVVFAYDSDINFREGKTWSDIDKMRRFTNVYVIDDKKKLLGGKEAKNSPVDVSQEVWEELYRNKRKIV